MVFKYKVQQGDTLNQIANRFGFSSFKDAGITSVPSGDFDLIRPGEEITLANYDPSKVKPIERTQDSISSLEGQGEFQTNTARLDEMSMPPKAPDKTPQPAERPKPEGDTASGLEGEGATTGDETTDYYALHEQGKKAKFKEAEEDAIAKVEQLKATSLAANDAEYQAVVANIEATYQRRLKEQRRVNDLVIGRAKAYGLGGAGAIMNPLEYTDIIAVREQEAADSITALDNERNALIAQAKAAQIRGETKILRDTLADIDRVREETRQKTKDLYTEVDRNTRRWREAREQAEKEEKEAVQRMVAAASVKYLDEFDKAKTKEEREKIIHRILEENGRGGDADSFFAIYRALGQEAASRREAALDIEKKEADIEASEQLAEQRRANALKAWRDANNIKTPEENTMEKDLPTSFSSRDDAESKRQAFVKKHGEKGKEYWDAVYLKGGTNTYGYQIGKGEKGGKKQQYGMVSEMYEPYRAELRPGEILVIDKKTGEVGAIPEGEFDEKKYTKL